MRVFPELSSGAAAQFPWRRLIRFRSVRNRFRAGDEIDFGDVPFERRSWELPLADLEDSEWQLIRDFFAETGGQRLPFTFVEPGSNLLAWSDSLGEAVWQKGGGLQVSTGVSDPKGETAANTVSAGSGWTLSQAVLAPAARAYVASAWIKSGSTGVAMSLSDGQGLTKQVGVASDDTWHLYEVSWREASTADQMTFEIAGSSGAAASVYGLQVEPQVARSSYKRTTAQSGIFPNAHFDRDSLIESLTAPNQYSGTLRIQWTPSPI
jgi:hypothetical protein